MGKSVSMQRTTDLRGHTNKTRKQADALDRQVQAARRTSEQQIAILDAKLGVGVGAVKERARLKTGME